MSRITRLAAAAGLAVAALAPAAPAHALQCKPETQAACTAYTAVCRRISTYDQLHQLLCYVN